MSGSCDGCLFFASPPHTFPQPEKIDINGDGELSRDEVVKGARLLELTKKEAGRLFDRLDVDSNGTLDRKEFDRAESRIKFESVVRAEYHPYAGGVVGWWGS